MAAFLSSIEAKLSAYMKPVNKEDWKEKTMAQAEKVSGFSRERMVLCMAMMIAIYSLFGSFLPLFSHIICLGWPVKESFAILRQQTKPSDQILLYWIVYALVSLLDYSSLVYLPFYYFCKCALFISMTANGYEKLREWSEPALRFTENWVFVQVPNEKED